MTSSARGALLWTPRGLGILVALYLGVFALDAFRDARSFSDALPGFLIHAAPSILLLLVVAVSWRFEWVGGVACIALALLYGATAWRRVDWILAIAGPLLLVGVLYLLSWRHRGTMSAPG